MASAGGGHRVQYEDDTALEILPYHGFFRPVAQVSENALLVAGLALVVAPVGTFLLLAGLYYYGLSVVPEAPRLAASSPVPETISAAMWARFGEDGPMRVESVTPWSLLRMRVCRAMAGNLGTAEQKEDCWRNHPGIATAGAAAVRHVGVQGLSRGGLAQVATAAWMTRHWSAEELLDQLAWQSDYGHGRHGFTRKRASGPAGGGQWRLLDARPIEMTPDKALHPDGRGC